MVAPAVAVVVKLQLYLIKFDVLSTGLFAEVKLEHVASSVGVLSRKYSTTILALVIAELTLTEKLTRYVVLVAKAAPRLFLTPPVPAVPMATFMSPIPLAYSPAVVV